MLVRLQLVFQLELLAHSYVRSTQLKMNGMNLTSLPPTMGNIGDHEVTLQY